MRPSLRPGVAQEIIGKSMEIQQRLHFRKYAPLEALRKRFFLLCLVQNEIDCFPFLMVASCIGPAIFLLVERKHNVESNC